MGYATGNPPPGITHALYDLKHDPGETRNLAKDPKHKAKLQELQQALLRRFKETHPLAKELPAGASVEEALGLVLRTARCQGEFGRLQILKNLIRTSLSGAAVCKSRAYFTAASSYPVIQTKAGIQIDRILTMETPLLMPGCAGMSMERLTSVHQNASP